MRIFQFSVEPKPRQRLSGALALLLMMATVLSSGVAVAMEGIPGAEPPTGTRWDVIPRIQCPTGYVAKSYAEGLSSPDGLAFGPEEVLYVAEEAAGRVSRIEADGSATPVVTELHQPEGIAFDASGFLFVVEDVPQPPDLSGGRLLKVTPAGITTTLTTNLDAPEGVVWEADGTLYVTELRSESP